MQPVFYLEQKLSKKRHLIKSRDKEITPTKTTGGTNIPTKVETGKSIITPL